MKPKQYMSSRNKIIKYIKDTFLILLLILGAGMLILELQNNLRSLSKLNDIDYGLNETDRFREMSMSADALTMLSKLAENEETSFSQLVTLLMLETDFDLHIWNTKSADITELEKTLEYIRQNKNGEFSQLQESYSAIWDDLKYFPIPLSLNEDRQDITYTDSWMSERSYGGIRGHEGTDLMAGDNVRGIYPVISMTDGTVEKIGWLEKGGYRIGIRAKSGAYFYYAHLSEYAEDFAEGDTVTAGQLLGMMGDSGYGQEGTVGQFDVHLHLGIYIKTENYDELSINPYWILKYLEDKRMVYSY